MTVAELIAELQQLPQDALVVQSKDGEGNSFSPHADYSVGFYYPDSTWSGEFHTVDEDDTDPDRFEPDPGDQQAVCLWPVN